MKTELKDIVILFPFDPATVKDKTSGNPAIYLKFINYLLKNDYKVYLIGVRESNKIFEHPNFKFIPLFNKPRHWILFSLTLLLKAPFLDIPPRGLITSSHMAYLLPFVLTNNKNPKVFESLFADFEAFKEHSNKIIYFLFRIIFSAIEPFFIRRMDALIVSPRYKKHYESKYPDIQDKLNVMIHESIDTKMFRPMNMESLRKKYKIPLSTKLIIQVAIINRIKRIELTIKSLELIKKEIPNIKLLIVGPTKNTKYKLYLDDLIKKLNLSKNVEFFGEVPLKIIPELINCSNVLIVSSPAEVGPNPPIEAFACGKPIVTTDVGLTNSLVKNNRLGRILPVDVNEKTFAHDVIEILNQEETYELISQRIKIAKTFDIEENQKKRLKACEMAYTNFYKKFSKFNK